MISSSTPALANTASSRPAAARENRKTETNLAVVLIGITTMHLVYYLSICSSIS